MNAEFSGRANILSNAVYCTCTGMLVALYQHMREIRTCVVTWLFTTFLAAHRDQLVSFETRGFCVSLTSIHFSMHLLRAAALLALADALRIASFLPSSVRGLIRGLCFLTIVQLLRWNLGGDCCDFEKWQQSYSCNRLWDRQNSVWLQSWLGSVLQFTPLQRQGQCSSELCVAMGVTRGALGANSGQFWAVTFA